MFQMLRHRLTSRTATFRYPEVPDTPPPTFRGLPDLLEGACRGAADCASVCPTAAITVQPRPDGWTWRLDRAACVACGLCVDACPNAALVIAPSFEFAARSRKDLETSVIFQGAVEASL